MILLLSVLMMKVSGEKEAFCVRKKGKFTFVGILAIPESLWF
jgi:hypothetical protein